VTKVSDGGAFFIPESFNIIRVAADEAPGHFFGTTYVRDEQGNILNAAGAPIKDASGKVTGIPAIGPRKLIGNPNPKGIWSFINEIGVGKSLSFRAQLDGVRGGDIFNFDRRLLETPAFGSGAAYADELNGVVPKGYFQDLLAATVAHASILVKRRADYDRRPQPQDMDGLHRLGSGDECGRSAYAGSRIQLCDRSDSEKCCSNSHSQLLTARHRR
jgi:hypothetical protein